MELRFPQTTISCLHRIRNGVQMVEQTQELRLPEEMPDIGHILATWGQVLIRSKQWRSGSMMVSGGVMTWVMYQPEGENQSVQTAEAWIPFQLKWDLPETKRDGTIRVIPLIQSMDARSASARKIIARVNVSVMAEAYEQQDSQVFQPGDVPKDICLQEKTYPLLLPREAGEKAFTMEEELELPTSAPPIRQLIRFSLQPELIDKKVLSGKVAFRGTALVHILYLSPEGQLCTWDFEIPFSKYTELDRDYEQDAQATIDLLLTGMELDLLPDGKLRLNAGLTGQYIIYDITYLQVAEDAYSPSRSVEVQKQALQLPTVLELGKHKITAEQTVRHGAGKVVDAAFYPDQPVVSANSRGISAGLGGMFQVLFQDEHGMLQGAAPRWDGSWETNAAENVKMGITVWPSGSAQGIPGASQVSLMADLSLETVAMDHTPISMITALELGEEISPDPNRPSLILQKKGKCSLWELAKKNGSTVSAIENANPNIEQANQETLILIPVV